MCVNFLRHFVNVVVYQLSLEGATKLLIYESTIPFILSFLAKNQRL